MIEVIGYTVVAFLFFFYVFPFLIGKEIIEDKSMLNAFFWSAVWPLVVSFGMYLRSVH